MQISVVIPTCNRKARLLSLLQLLQLSTYRFYEVIIIDSGEELLSPGEYAVFNNLHIQYLQSVKSVCVQRNIGIQKAGADWIFLCDDDIEVPADYINKLAHHIDAHPEAGAVSGVVLQKENNEWVGKYPVNSAKSLVWKYIFQLSIWGEITWTGKNSWVNSIKKHYRQKRNHISKAGWPVLTDFSGDYSVTPIYGLGASLIKKEWLLNSLYDEVLDPHGIGDNYGVAVGFPLPGIHIVNNAFIYHHQEPVNRLKKSLQYYRRTLALHYFAKTKPALKHIKTHRIIWSLAGNFISFVYVMDGVMISTTLKLITKILFNRNPYVMAHKKGKRVVEPMV